MVGQSCCVAGCNNKSYSNPKVQFYLFPFNNLVLLNEWLLAIKRLKAVPKPNDYVCSEHFEPSDFTKIPGTTKRFLRKEAVPSVFPEYYTYNKRKFRYNLQRAQENLNFCEARLDSQEFEELPQPFESIEVKVEPLESDGEMVVPEASTSSISDHGKEREMMVERQNQLLENESALHDVRMKEAQLRLKLVEEQLKQQATIFELQKTKLELEINKLKGEKLIILDHYNE